MLVWSYVSEQDFIACIGSVTAVAGRLDVPTTQFELLTAGALTIFRDAGLEWAVLEAGLRTRSWGITIVVGHRHSVLDSGYGFTD
jgi:folylpolyglutamate synthase/dihydropteroate synthase